MVSSWNEFSWACIFGSFSAHADRSWVRYFDKIIWQLRVGETEPSNNFILRWRHNGRDSVSNHQPQDRLLDCLFRRRSKKTSKPRVTGLSAGNSPGTGEFPAQMASNAENVSIWWRHHVTQTLQEGDEECCSHPRKQDNSKAYLGSSSDKTLLNVFIFMYSEFSAYLNCFSKISTNIVNVVVGVL